VRAALGVAGVLPAARDWRVFLDRLLLWSGAVALAAAVVFFIAHNWNDLGKFAKFGLAELLLIAAVLGYWRLGADRASGKASLLVASIFLGALLALFGQTYQTGADTWELFANWAVLIAPWVLIGRFSGLWMLWVAVANVAIVFYFRVFPGIFGIVFSAERQLWTLFAFNTVVLIGWEFAGRRVAWLGERWAPRLLAIAGGATITLLMVQTILDWREMSAAALIAHTPWYVRVMLGIAGWIAAGFLLGFVGIGFAFVMESKTASLAVGLMLIAAAYAVFRAAPRNDFTSMFALAVSFAGQALMIFGVVGLFERHIDGGLPFAIVAAIEAVLAVLMPNFIHRTASAYAAGLAFAFACEAAGAHFVPAGLLAAAVAVVWLNEARLGKLHAVVTPIGYGLTLSFVQIEGTALFGHSMATMFGSRGAPGAWPWVGEALAVAALPVSVWVLLKREGRALSESRSLLAAIATLAIGAASFKAPGIAGGLMIALLGFSNGNRVLVGLGIAALLFYVSSYYYLLDATLLLKSGALMVTGLVLLAGRWLVLNVVMPKGGADA
jgi:uncharacterized membrane protein